MSREEASYVRLVSEGRQKFSPSPDYLSSLVKMYLDRIETEEVDEISDIGLQTIASSIGTSLVNGLDENSNLDERKKLYGSNDLEKLGFAIYCKYLFQSPQCQMTLILLILTTILIIFQNLFLDRQNQTMTVLFFILFIYQLCYTPISFSNRPKPADFSKNFITVRRSDSLKEINLLDLQVGDKFFMDTGDIIPADGILLESSCFNCDESAITGARTLKRKLSVEACKQSKNKKEEPLDTLPSPIVLSTSRLVEGSGWILAIAVGYNSAFISRKNEIAMKHKEKLEVKIKELNNKLKAKAVFAATFIICFSTVKAFGLGVWSETLDKILESAILASGLVWIMISDAVENLLKLVSAFSIKHLSDQSCVATDLSLIETMGRVDYLICDKERLLTDADFKIHEVVSFGTDGKAQYQSLRKFRKLFPTFSDLKILSWQN